MFLRRMMKKLSLALAVLLALGILILPASAKVAVTTLYVRGQELITTPEICRISGVTYVPLRGFVTALDETAEFSWNDRTSTATVTVKGLELKVPQNEKYIVANGRYLYLNGTVHNENGSLMLPVRPLAKAFGVNVDWDEVHQSVYVSGDVDPILPDWCFYNEETLYWLSHIVYAEAGIEPLDGQIAVAEVVLNRVDKRCWPNTVYEVVFDTRAGVQFSPITNGTIYLEPSKEAVIAAKLALDGADVVGDSYFFLNPDIANSGWFDRNCEYVTTIGSHRFYTSELW